MKVIDFELDKVVAQDLMKSLEGFGVEQLKIIKNFLVITKPKLDALIVCKGIFGTFLELVDGMATDYGVDFLIKLIDKLIAEIEK